VQALVRSGMSAEGGQQARERTPCADTQFGHGPLALSRPPARQGIRDSREALGPEVCVALLSPGVGLVEGAWVARMGGEGPREGGVLSQSKVRLPTVRQRFRRCKGHAERSMDPDRPKDATWHSRRSKTRKSYAGNLHCLGTGSLSLVPESCPGRPGPYPEPCKVVAGPRKPKPPIPFLNPSSFGERHEEPEA